MKVLITGVAGSGKTTVAAELKCQGYSAYDVDTETDIPYSMNIETGKKEVIPVPRPQGWRLNHRWIWDSAALNEFFKKHSNVDVFLCGGADNLSDYYDSFDKLFVLEAKPEILLGRLATRTHTEYGKQQNERDEALRAQEQVVKSITEHQGSVINTDQPLGSVVKEILRQTYDR